MMLLLGAMLVTCASGQALICASSVANSPVSAWAFSLPPGPYRAFLYGSTEGAPEAWFALGSAGAMVVADGGGSAAFWWPSVSAASSSAHALAVFVLPLAAAPPFGSATDLGPAAPPAGASGPIPPALVAAALQQGAVLRGAPQAGCASVERTGGLPQSTSDFASSLQEGLASIARLQAAPSPATAAATALPALSSGAAAAAAAAAAGALALAAGLGLLL